MSMDSQYQYQKLVGPSKIRLLRVQPDDNATARIQCQLFDYTLDGVMGEGQPFEALSYCWGSPAPEGTHSISIKSSSLPVTFFSLPVTANLYAALLQLRNRIVDRILWIDAVCINQTDDQEKGQQIGLMYSIYSCANCVLVWLGDKVDDSDQAMEALRITGSQSAANPVYNERAQESVMHLLKQDWFRRIWVSMKSLYKSDILNP